MGLILFLGVGVRIVVIGRGLMIVFFAVRFRRIAGLVSARLFLDAFPMASIDGMGQSLHFSKGWRFSLLTYYIFDLLCKSRIVTVMEDSDTLMFT